MNTVQQFKSTKDFWDGMVGPDYSDSQNTRGDLRVALHAAISLFHMHDWVFQQHSSTICNSFQFVDKNGLLRQVNSAATFANSLERIEADFALIRGIANAGKHLSLSDVRPHQDAPSHAANTAVQSLGFGEGAYDVGPWGGGPQVMLEGATGYLHFSQIAEKVFMMWNNLNTQYNWW